MTESRATPLVVRAALDAARSALAAGDTATAEAQCRRALAAGDDGALGWTLLGQCLRRSQPDAALAAFNRALASDPRCADAHFHLGNLHREQLRAADAVAAYERALAGAPGHPSILNNLGLALELAGDGERAIATYRQVLQRQPAHRQALGNLAHLLCGRRDYTAALPLIEDYLRRYPDADAAVWIDLGLACEHHLGDLDRAEAAYRRAVERNPQDPVAQLNLGALRLARGDHEGAAAALAASVAGDPGRRFATTLLALTRQYLCDWDGLDALHARIAADIATGIPAGDAANPFATLAMPVEPAIQQLAAASWARFWQPATTLPPVTPRPATGRRLRLGYLSTDFREHPITALLGEVWARTDRARFETFAYSIGPPDASALRRRVEASFDHFVDCHREVPRATAARIRADRIDILVDLNGYTHQSRCEILLQRPAPLQASWLGYLGTLGTDAIDVVITDRFATPEALQPAFTERFLLLPDCCMPSDTRREVAPPPPSREACGLPRDGFVFCCFNNPYKILPPMFAVWMRLLAATPASVLWLSPGNPVATANLRREAQHRGVDPERLVFAPRVPPAEHLARQVHADLFLDTLPYNAGTTANDALLVGLPVLTCAGATMAGRIAGSELLAIGLPELVTFSLVDYEQRALHLARNPVRLRRLREQLATNRAHAPLFDMPQFTRNFEDALLRAWEERAESAASPGGALR